MPTIDILSDKLDEVHELIHQLQDDNENNPNADEGNQAKLDEAEQAIHNLQALIGDLIP